MNQSSDGTMGYLQYSNKVDSSADFLLDFLRYIGWAYSINFTGFCVGILGEGSPFYKFIVTTWGDRRTIFVRLAYNLADRGCVKLTTSSVMGFSSPEYTVFIYPDPRGETLYLDEQGRPGAVGTLAIGPSTSVGQLRASVPFPPRPPGKNVDAVLKGFHEAIAYGKIFANFQLPREALHILGGATFAPAFAGRVSH
jgi:hypothetical protein